MTRFGSRSHVRHLLVLLGFWSLQAVAQPALTGTYQGSLTSRLDWSSDLGPPIVNSTGVVAGNGNPLMQSASAVPNGRLIQTEITQIAPYILGGQYVAASWTGTSDIPGGAFYGLFATSLAAGSWNFSIAGMTTEQSRAATIFYASKWDVLGSAAIHPTFAAQFTNVPAPLSGTQTGSFTLQSLASVGINGFPISISFGAATQSLDTNGPESLTFSYQIAFSTSPIGAGVFATPVPEPGVPALLLAGLGIVGWRVRRAARQVQ